MERRSFFNRFFAVLGAPLALFLAPSKGFLESLSKWPSGLSQATSYRTYIMGSDAIYFDKDVLSTLKRENTLFEEIASHRATPMHPGGTRQFFQYEMKS